MKKTRVKNITVKQKVNGWTKFIEYMIEFYSSDIQEEICDGVDFDYIDRIENSAYKITILVSLYREVVDDYECIDWDSYMISLSYKRNYLEDRLNEIPIGDDVINAMLNDAFGKEV